MCKVWWKDLRVWRRLWETLWARSKLLFRSLSKSCRAAVPSCDSSWGYVSSVGGRWDLRAEGGEADGQHWGGMEELGLPSLMGRDIALIKQHNSLDYLEIIAAEMQEIFHCWVAMGIMRHKIPNLSDIEGKKPTVGILLSLSNCRFATVSISWLASGGQERKQHRSPAGCLPMGWRRRKSTSWQGREKEPQGKAYRPQQTVKHQVVWQW